MTKVSIAGHFTIGEQPKQVDYQTIQRAREQNKAIAIVVNDIDLERRLLYYQLSGIDGIIQRYKQREGKQCGTTADVCEIPNEEELRAIIDEEFYMSLLDSVQVKGRFSLKNQVQREIIRQEIERYALERVQAYDIGLETSVYFERRLRNRASERLRESRKTSKKSWMQACERAKILDELKAQSKVPVCGAIMLALYEMLKEYEHIHHIFRTSDKAPIENARRLHGLLNQANPEDPRWQTTLSAEYL